MSDKEKIKAGLSKLRKQNAKVIAIRNMIALARIRSIEGAAGKNGVDGMRGLNGLDGINGTNGFDGMRGAKGPTGSKGEMGAVGPQGEKGEAGMTWRGTYRNDIEYDIGDVVGVSGSAYVCIAPTNQSPPVGFGWELLVSRGAQGVRGIKGDTGSGSAIDLPVSILNGGTGKTTDKEAINALLPSQVGKSGKFLSTEGVNLLWADASIPAVPDADSLTGTELAANVVTSSLTSTGTLAALTVTAPIAGSITGNAATATSATSATTAGTVTTAAQPTITSVGTLTAVNTSGVITGTNTTASTSSATGAVIIAGGLGIAKDSFINGHKVGRGAGNSDTNIAIGRLALDNNTGTNVTALGVQAADQNTGTGVVTIGYQAGYYNHSDSLVAIGSGAGVSNTGVQNICIGGSAGTSNNAAGIVAIGFNACASNTGASVVALGAAAGAAGSGALLCAIGTNAGYGHSGYGAVAIGGYAMLSSASGNRNTAIGSNSLDACSTGGNNTAIGAHSFTDLTTGASNVAVGGYAGELLTTGSNNVILGFEAKFAAVGNDNSIVIGKGATGLGSNTTIIGVAATTAATIHGALSLPSTTASTSSTTGALIVSGGAGFAKDININGANAGIGAGTNNTKFGKDAHSQMASGGDSCTAFGYQAGFWNSTGDGNSGFGANALLETRAGSWNSAFGINALLTNQTGSHNVACGLEALYFAVADNNTGIGSNSGYHLAGVSTNNICIGYIAGKFHADGTTALTASSNSCYLGAGSRGLNNSDSNSIVIGSSAIGIGANTTVIGTSATTANRIFGVQATGEVAPTIASAATIAPTKQITFISGTTAINTITAPTGIATTGGQITLIPTGIFTTTTAGNIALASTAVVSRALIMTYDSTTAKWYPSY